MSSVVIPVAGLGTRSLPASKVIPKEMMPLFDRPIIQYIVEEAVQSGFKDIVFVTSEGKSVLKEHFSINKDLESALKKANKTEIYKKVYELSRLVKIQTVDQKEARGLGHAVLMAEPVIKDSHFAVCLGDEVMASDPTALQQLHEVYKSVSAQVKDAGVVLLMQVPEVEISKYGICEVDDSKPRRIVRCLEKPNAQDTSSRLALIGRYFLPRNIFPMLKKQKPGRLGEIQLTDGLNVLAQEGKLYGCHYKGLRFDAGDRLGFLRANLHYYLKSEHREAVLNLIKETLE